MYDQAMRQSPGGAQLFELLRQRITGSRSTRLRSIRRIERPGTVNLFGHWTQVGR